MRAGRVYANPAAVAKMSKYLVDSGQTVLHIHRLAETQDSHVGELLKHFDPPMNARILDVGCGLGGVSAIMSANRPDLHFTLLNNSAEQLALCPPHFTKVCADAHEIPLPDASYSAVMICYAIGHMDLSKVFEECARVTKPGGWLFIYDLTGDGSKLAVDTLDFELYSVAHITAAAAQAGYTVDKTLLPKGTHVAHFYDKIPEPKFAEIFSEIQPALFRFHKTKVGLKVNRLKRILASAALALSGSAA